VIALWAALASASGVREGLACEQASDLACAKGALQDAPPGGETDLLKARVAFDEGRFVEAEALMANLPDSLSKDEHYRWELDVMRATVRATEGTVVERRGDVEIRYLPGRDEVLLDDAFEVLQAAHDRISPQLGGAPPGTVRLEIYPTVERFIAASSLPADAVRTTGVVALSKWTRLLATSPRALGRGYSWKDSVAHEYIHLVVAWRTRDRTPVWLQEGIARSYEALWRQEQVPPLAPHQAALLARALREDKLVPFSKMHPSFALLPSAEEASLAYAQVSTMVEFVRESAGAEGVGRALDEIREGMDPLQSLANAATGGDPIRFWAGWRAMLEARKLDRRSLGAPPAAVDPGADEFAGDPGLAARRDLANRARLGDLLADREQWAAAMVEYAQAVPDGEPPSPAIARRLAAALEGLHRSAEAVRVLEQSVADYPEFPVTRTALGEAYARAGRVSDAIAQLRASLDVDPFDMAVQGRLADLYTVAGDATSAARHARYRRLLELGGSLTGSP
jgi:tetratricopeptide (TPR) repeat protein